MLDESCDTESGILADIGRSINPTLRIHRTERSRIPLDELFNIRSYTNAIAGGEEAAKEEVERAERYTRSIPQGQVHKHQHEHDHEHEHSSPTTIHDNGITSTLIPLRPLSDSGFEKLGDFLESVLWGGHLPLKMTGGEKVSLGYNDDKEEGRGGVEVLRTKGLIRRDDGREYILQGVTDVFELKELPKVSSPSSSSMPSGKVVFIGRGVELLKERLTEYLST